MRFALTSTLKPFQCETVARLRDIITRLRDACPVCIDNDASAIAKCRHKCCWTCWNAIFKNNSDGRRGLPVSDASCPVCRTMLYYSDISDIASLSNASDASTIAFEDSKFIATLKLIRHHRDSRIIVASNWIHPLLALKENYLKTWE